MRPSVSVREVTATSAGARAAVRTITDRNKGFLCDAYSVARWGGDRQRKSHRQDFPSASTRGRTRHAFSHADLDRQLEPTRPNRKTNGDCRHI